MSNYDDQVPVTRGRRDPNLATMLDAERALVQDESSGDVADDGVEFLLLPGDMIMGKTTLGYKTAVGDAWSTFGAQTHLLEGEDIDDGFERLSTVVNASVIELAKDAQQRVVQELDETPRGRIRPQH